MSNFWRLEVPFQSGCCAGLPACSVSLGRAASRLLGQCHIKQVLTYINLLVSLCLISLDRFKRICVTSPYILRHPPARRQCVVKITIAIECVMLRGLTGPGGPRNRRVVESFRLEETRNATTSCCQPGTAKPSTHTRPSRHTASHREAAAPTGCWGASAEIPGQITEY